MEDEGLILREQLEAVWCQYSITFTPETTSRGMAVVEAKKTAETFSTDHLPRLVPILDRVPSCPEIHRGAQAASR